MGNIRTDVVRNLTTSLVLHNRVVTSRVKARAVKQVIDRLLAKVAANQNLTTRRALNGYLYNDKAVAKIFELIAPNLGEKRSGFVQLFKLPARRRDASDRTMLALLPELLTVKKAEPNDEKTIERNRLKGSSEHVGARSPVATGPDARSRARSRSKQKK